MNEDIFDTFNADVLLDIGRRCRNLNLFLTCRRSYSVFMNTFNQNDRDSLLCKHLLNSDELDAAINKVTMCPCQQLKQRLIMLLIVDDQSALLKYANNFIICAYETQTPFIVVRALFDKHNASDIGSAMILAIEKNELQCLRHLCTKTEAQNCKHIMNAVTLACCQDNVEIVQLLLDVPLSNTSLEWHKNIRARELMAVVKCLMPNLGSPVHNCLLAIENEYVYAAQYFIRCIRDTAILTNHAFNLILERAVYCKSTNVIRYLLDTTKSRNFQLNDDVLATITSDTSVHGFAVCDMVVKHCYEIVDSVLMKCAYWGNRGQMMEYLIHNHRVSNPDELLHMSCIRGDIETVSIVLKHGIQFTQDAFISCCIFCPFHQAIPIVNLLLGHGVPCDDTILFTAAYAQQVQIISLFIHKFGIHSIERALIFSCSNSTVKVARILKTVKYLIRAGATNVDEAFLAYVSFGSGTSVLRYLLKYARYNNRNSINLHQIQDSIYIAGKRGNKRIVEFLLGLFGEDRIDLQKLLITAVRHNKTSSQLVKFLLTQTDARRYLMDALNVSIRSRNMRIIKYISSLVEWNSSVASKTMKIVDYCSDELVTSYFNQLLSPIFSDIQSHNFG